MARIAKGREGECQRVVRRQQVLRAWRCIQVAALLCVPCSQCLRCRAGVMTGRPAGKTGRSKGNSRPNTGGGKALAWCLIDCDKAKSKSKDFCPGSSVSQSNRQTYHRLPVLTGRSRRPQPPAAAAAAGC